MAAFSDYQKNFFVFDNGTIRQLEYQPVISFSVGDNCIGYQTNGNHLKIYYNHLDFDVASMVKNYTVTNHLVSYQIGSQLYVFDNGRKTLLSKFVGNYLVGDSLIAFFDTEKYFFQLYYRGEIITLEDGILYENISAFKVGSNMLAYIDAFTNFKVFYLGETTEILKTSNVTTEVGRNVMAYIDPVSESFQVFFKGEITQLESFKPKSFQAGYEKVAYVDNVGNFKLFDNGETYTVSNFEPDSYQLKDNMLAFEQQGILFAFYQGEKYTIENYIPSSYLINDHFVAYLDQNGYLNLFDSGENQVLTYQTVNSFDVLRNVVIFNEGVNTTKIFYNGEFYTR